MFNSIQRAILRVDLSGAIKTINNNAIELLGFNENDIKSMKMWDLIPDWSMVLDEIYDKGSFVDEDVYVHCLKINFN